MIPKESGIPYREWNLLKKLDPRCRILAFVILALITATGENIFMLSQIAILAFLMVAASGIEPRAGIKRLAAVNFFMALIWFFLPLSYPGQPLFSIGALTWSRTGIYEAVRITLRANAIMLMTLSLLAAMPVPALLRALKQLGIPEGFIKLLLFIYRYIFVLEDELQSLRVALRCRGFRPESRIGTYRIYARLLGMVLLRSQRRSIRVHNALQSRGFRGDFYLDGPLGMAGGDLFFVLVVLVFSGWFIMLDNGLFV